MKKRNSTARVSAALVLLASIAAACGSGDALEETEDLGRATLSIAQVPAQTFCVKVTVANTLRSVDRLLDVAPGQPSVKQLDGLPTGAAVTFTGFAYSLACSSVNPGSIATWRTEPTNIALSAGVPTNVTLTFRPNGVADVTADFVSDSGTCVATACSAPTDSVCAPTTVQTSDCAPGFVATATCTLGPKTASCDASCTCEPAP